MIKSIDLKDLGYLKFIIYLLIYNVTHLQSRRIRWTPTSQMSLPQRITHRPREQLRSTHSKARTQFRNQGRIRIQIRALQTKRCRNQ